MCVTVLKKRCRRHGVRRWPHRKLKSLDKLKGKLEREEAMSADKQYYQAEIHSIVQKKDLLFRMTASPLYNPPSAVETPLAGGSAPGHPTAGTADAIAAAAAEAAAVGVGVLTPNTQQHPHLHSSLRAHSAAHPQMAMSSAGHMAFGAPAVSFCGIVGCDCFMMSGVSSHGLHPPLSLAGRPSAFYPSPVPSAHAGGTSMPPPPQFHYAFMPYAAAHQHQHRIMRMRVVDPSHSGGPAGSTAAVAGVDRSGASPYASQARSQARSRTPIHHDDIVAASGSRSGDGSGNDGSGDRSGSGSRDMNDSLIGSSSSGELIQQAGTCDGAQLAVHQLRRAHHKAVGGGGRSAHERIGEGAQAKGTTALYAAAVAAANMHTSAGCFLYGGSPPAGSALATTQESGVPGKSRESTAKVPTVYGRGSTAKQPGDGILSGTGQPGNVNNGVSGGSNNISDVRGAGKGLREGQQAPVAATEAAAPSLPGPKSSVRLSGVYSACDSFEDGAVGGSVLACPFVRKIRNEAAVAVARVRDNPSSNALMTAVAEVDTDGQASGVSGDGSGSEIRCGSRIGSGSAKGSDANMNRDSSSPPPCSEVGTGAEFGSGSGSVFGGHARRPSQSPPTTDGFLSSDQDTRNSSDDTTTLPREVETGRLPAGPASSGVQPPSYGSAGASGGITRPNKRSRIGGNSSGGGVDSGVAWPGPGVMAAVGSAVWTVEADGRVCSASGAQTLLDAACVPAAGGVLQADGAGAYERVRGGERVEAVVSAGGGRQFLQVLAPLRRDGGAAGGGGVVVAGMAVELGQATAQALESLS